MSFERQNMDPRDAETAKWLGGVIDAGDSPASSTAFLPTSTLSKDQVTATSAAAVASQANTRAVTSDGNYASRAAASGATSDEQLAPPIIGATTAKPAAVVASMSRTSLTGGQQSAAKRASKLAAAGAQEALHQPRQTETYRASRFSSAGAAASLAAGAASPSRMSQQRANDLALEKRAASRAAVLAARDTAPYEIPEHALSANAGKAALLAAKDHVEYEAPPHQMSANAGKAALLAHHDHVEYEVPEHELSANAGRAALLAANDHKIYEVPPHKMSVNAGTAALLAANNPVQVEVPVHQMSASASSAALQAHQDHREYEVPPHQLSVNAGKAALLAHHDHREYQVPEYTLSANAGKAALLAHRESASAPAKTDGGGAAAGAASALRAATQAHHDPAMRPTKPEDLQAKGAANALKAASQAHREAPAAFKYVHPADHPDIGKLARSNTQGYLAEMQSRDPDEHAIKYANASYNNARARQSQADTYRAISDEAYQAAGLGSRSTQADLSTTNVKRSRTNTGSTSKPPVDLMALAKRNVDSQMAERGLTRTASQQSVSTIGAANRGATLAFRDGQARQLESDRRTESVMSDREISERINREMAQFDQQRKRNLNNTLVQSSLMETARRNARLSMAQMEANRPYTAPNLQDTQRMEDLLNDQKMAARRNQPAGAMVNLGGGHYMSQVEIEAVAARRIQPIFAEMDEQVAEINRRKAEIQAQREAEVARREEESAERRRVQAIEREEERKHKEADKKAKAEAKALEKERQAKIAAERAAEKQKREDAAAKERRERQAMLEAERHRRQETSTAEQSDAARLAVSSSTEAVATAGAATQVEQRESESESSHHETRLPGTNEPLSDQTAPVTEVETTTTTEVTEVAPVNVADNDDDTLDITYVTGSRHIAALARGSSYAPELHRSNTTDSVRTEEVATYEVENHGMVTDTEGETDDEWADASEETPAIERAEYINFKPLTNDNLASRGSVIREESTEDAETASISTARPTKAGTAASNEDSLDIAPPLTRSTNGATHHEQTRFKEELA